MTKPCKIPKLTRIGQRQLGVSFPEGARSHSVHVTMEKLGRSMWNTWRVFQNKDGNYRWSWFFTTGELRILLNHLSNMPVPCLDSFALSAFVKEHQISSWGSAWHGFMPDDQRLTAAASYSPDRLLHADKSLGITGGQAQSDARMPGALCRCLGLMQRLSNCPASADASGIRQFRHIEAFAKRLLDETRTAPKPTMSISPVVDVAPDFSKPADWWSLLVHPSLSLSNLTL